MLEGHDRGRLSCQDRIALCVPTGVRRETSLSPTIFRAGGFRFYFFSREERRIHVHVYCERGEAKFWLTPKIELARNFGMSAKQLRSAKAIVEERKDEICNAWEEHFGS